jgi:mannose-1-phosphate guanylyltransferase/mannose-6-phosphate isomerase
MFPKQLLALAGERSMLQETVTRLGKLAVKPVEPLVVCNRAHRFLVTGQLREVGINPTVVLEPQGRNTAPAAAVAALLSRGRADGPALLLVLPADHVIADTRALIEAVSRAVSAAEQGSLVTFGVVPTGPETGYGYIRAAKQTAEVRPVDRFVEKPDFETARRYTQSSAYFWNSGMFLFSTEAFLQELKAHAPAILDACRKAVGRSTREANFVHLDEAAFLACPEDSIDYAVMEKTDQASMVPLDAGWSDVGSWASLHAVSSQDSDGNVCIGDVVAVDCHDSYLRSESRLVTAVGVDACVIIETKDAVLVAPQNRTQEVKKLVDELVSHDRAEVQLGREVFRPWGSYDSLENGAGYQVKRLAVLPGAVLSLQLHKHRAEHWVVVSGTARITRNDELIELKKNEHVYIPIGTKHRIENPGPDLLQIIEVQVGDYLGEDDIVRFEDKYGRQGRTD